MKRILTVVLAVLAMAILATTAVSAESAELKLSFGEAVLNDDGTVSMDLIIDENPGFFYLSFYLEYDENVVVDVDVEKKIDDFSLTTGKAIVLTMQSSDCTETGVLLTLTFTLAEDAPHATFPITFMDGESFNGDALRFCCNYNEELIDVALEDGEITVEHEVEHVDAVAPACHYDGNIEYWYCDACEIVWADEALTQVTNRKSVILPATGSDLFVHMDAVAPACHFAGNIEHWICYECEQVWADEALTQLTNIKNVILPATGSDLLVHVDAVAPACHFAGNIEHWICYECEQVWTDETLTQLTNIKNVVLPELGGDVVHVEAVANGCGADGNIEHWYCEECDQVWADEARTQLTNLKNVILPALEHDLVHVEAVEAGCHYEGNIEHWYCTVCETVWSDEALTQITNHKSVIVPATGSDLFVHMDAVAPGCHMDGNTEYWICYECEQVWADEALTQLTNIKNVILPATGSDLLVHMDTVAPDCHYAGNVEYWICYECDQVWTDKALTQLTNIKNVVLPELGGDVVHVEAVANGCGADGNIEHWYCEECGQVWADEARTQLTNHMSVRLPALEHDLVHVEAVAPGCHYEGNIEHWYCTVCETVWSDEALMQITNHKSVILPELGGNVVHMDAVAPGCHFAGNTEYWICYECEKVWADEARTQLTNIKNVVLPELGGDVIHVEAVVPSCMNEGNIEYWYCEECDQVWADEARTQLTNHMSVILPAAEHTIVHINAVAPGCHYEGNIEHWYCTVCETVWSDEALTRITNHMSVILPELGGDVVHMDAVAPGCHFTGNIEYWICYECEQVWADEARTQLTNIKNVVLSELGGNVIHVEAVEPTKDADGNIEHWYCEECEQFWQDEARTQPTNSKNVILPKLEGYDFGDVDGNGVVDVVDYMKLKRTILNTYELTEDELSRSDIDGNGEINTIDYMMLKRYFLNTWTPVAAKPEND